MMTAIGFSRQSQNVVVAIADSLISQGSTATLDIRAPKILHLPITYFGLSNGDTGTFTEIECRRTIGIAYTGKVEPCLVAYAKASSLCQGLTVTPDHVPGHAKFKKYDLEQIAAIVQRMLVDTTRTYGEAGIVPSNKNIIYVLGYCPPSGKVRLFECREAYLETEKKVGGYDYREIDLTMGKPMALVQGSSVLQSKVDGLIELSQISPDGVLTDAFKEALLSPTKWKTVGGYLQAASASQSGFQYHGNTFDGEPSHCAGANNAAKMYGYDYNELVNILGCEYAASFLLTDN